MRPDPIFVVGPQRTGTTLMGRIIAEADGVALTVNGKLAYYLLVWLPRDGFLDALSHFRSDEILWSLRRKPVLSPHPGFVARFESHGAALAENLRREGERSREPFIAEYLRRFYAGWCPGSRVWGDKYNEYVFVLDDLAAIFPGARFIFMRRDAEVAARSAIAAFSGRPWQPRKLESAVEKVEAWDRRIDLFRSQNPSISTCLVGYEALVETPDKVLREVAAFTDIDGLDSQAAKKIGDARSTTMRES